MIQDEFEYFTHGRRRMGNGPAIADELARIEKMRFCADCGHAMVWRPEPSLGSKFDSETGKPTVMYERLVCGRKRSWWAKKKAELQFQCLDTVFVRQKKTGGPN